MHVGVRKNHHNGNHFLSKPAAKIKCAVFGGVSAGKTSILRRYFHGSIPSPESTRNPTLGSDFYSRNIACAIEDHSDEVTVSLTVWDTPGRENLASRKSKYRAAFSDSFFRSLDAIILVYDVSSSTSFTHVLQWHADLSERMKRLVDSGVRDRALPILVAANKMDIMMKRRGTEQSRPQHTKNKRDVIGLRGKDFRGKDSRYEYTVSQQPPTIRHNLPSPGESRAETKGDRNRFELSTYMGTGDQYLEQFFNNEYRGSYLESLVSTEEKSHPDMEMVLLWCRRNRLIHHTVSALDGTGIDDLMVSMTRLAMQSRVDDPATQPKSTEIVSWSVLNEELDVHRRYENKRCHFPLFHKCCN